MAYDHDHSKSAAQLQREVAEQRLSIERKLNELQERMSPSAIADNLFNSRVVSDVVHGTMRGGGEFAGNLGRAVTSNPVPATLLGISLAWLMAGTRSNGHAAPAAYRGYPVRTVEGDALQRVSHARDEAGEWFSEFTDGAGETYRAKSNEMGHRVGEFVDSAGKRFGGFVDKSGRAVTRFTDEAGNALEAATGWAQGAVDAIGGAAGDMARSASEMGGGIADSATRMGSSIQHRASRASEDAMRMMREQPLLAGAIAFAAGAAIAAALPRTRQEDEMVGELSDQAKGEAVRRASELYEDGKEAVSGLYDEASKEAEDLYADAKDKVTGGRKGERADPGIRH